MTRPGKAANFQKVRENVSETSGGEEDMEFVTLLKRYQQAGAPMVIDVAGTKMLFFARTPIELGLGSLPNPMDLAAGEWQTFLGDTLGPGGSRTGSGQVAGGVALQLRLLPARAHRG